MSQIGVPEPRSGEELGRLSVLSPGVTPAHQSTGSSPTRKPREAQLSRPHGQPLQRMLSKEGDGEHGRRGLAILHLAEGLTVKKHPSAFAQPGHWCIARGIASSVPGRVRVGASVLRRGHADPGRCGGGNGASAAAQLAAGAWVSVRSWELGAAGHGGSAPACCKRSRG